ncbi:hypothetical protein OD800_20145 [Pseudomonas aeruginosa]|uniref:hypothetical protein n=1 Tax=Pseudomonas aeruginosa TaxID=287 RepID=UPI00071BB22E|nr:hypothetical protein [Pseudomonas aeruginosa]KSD30186.1 hypothetical protein AO902_27370 [Pseudomonas aeruginosa]MBH8876727.1 hypothetical protein [Pseudomonas aeruginosa]MBU8392961.1 hypothetical protein [Pseudomonas aeruginosa]MBY1012974.1 hypothetical protein [Pseudomonas aeruginosa]MCO2227555.1 hypothetical protein [Pseudomonas aeruginosa]
MTMLPLRQIERILNASACSSHFRCRRAADGGLTVTVASARRPADEATTVAGVSQEECRCERSVRELARELERSFTEQ